MKRTIMTISLITTINKVTVKKGKDPDQGKSKLKTNMTMIIKLNL